MSGIRWLSAADDPESLPDPREALLEPNGLLAAGGSLAPAWLLAAYRRGIFPWYEDGQPILWWAPDPRMVLFPEGLSVSRSLRKTLRQGRFEVTSDRDFAGVIAGCAAPRRYTDATWITAEMADAYLRLHDLGWAHSMETWRNGRLVGGLYGVAIGRAFFGESMFSLVPDASKVALVHAVRFLEHQGYGLIDCQLPSEHLRRLGAVNVSRRDFTALLARTVSPPGSPGPWSDSFDRYERASQEH